MLQAKDRQNDAENDAGKETKKNNGRKKYKIKRREYLIRSFTRCATIRCQQRIFGYRGNNENRKKSVVVIVKREHAEHTATSRAHQSNEHLCAPARTRWQ